MKRLILIAGIIVSIAAARLAFGQSEGVLTYEVKVNMHRTLPPDRQEMKSMIPEYRITKDQLFFTSAESLHRPFEEEEDEEIDDGEGVQIRMRRPMIEFYVNQQLGKRIVLQEFMGKKYVIEDSLKIIPWKLSGETREILGFTCWRADHYNEETKTSTTVWYTDRLRPFLGPESFNTLPGTVLQVDINDGERVITAIKFEPRPVKQSDLKLSSGGTRTTEAEFRKTRDEQIERMRANGGNIIIRN